MDCPVNFGSAEGIVYTRNGNNNFSVAMSGAITGTNGLTKAGMGTLNLKGDSSATLFGQITVDEGTLAYYNISIGDNDKVLGAPGNSIVLDGGTLLFNANVNIARNITIGPAGGTFSNGGSGYMGLSGLISGSGVFTISSTNSYISNSGNTYSGGTYVTGTVDVQANGALGTGPVALSGNVYLDGSSNTLGTYGQRFTLLGNGLLWGNCQTLSIGSLEGIGTAKVILDANNNAFSTMLTIGSDNTSTEFDGTIMNYTNTTSINGSIAKTGSGTLTLGGYNIYTGTTTVNQGELDINGTLAATGQPSATSMVTVNSGGTLGGSGLINRDVTVASGGIIAPGGTGTVGTLTLGGALNLNSGSKFTYDLAAPTASDVLAFGGGTLTLAGKVSVNFLSGFTLARHVSLDHVYLGHDALDLGPEHGQLGAPQRNAAELRPERQSSTQVALTVTRTGNAGTFNWTGASGTNWANGTNWDKYGLLPTSIDTAAFNLTANPTTTVGTAQSIATLALNNTGTLTLNGAAALSATNAVVLAGGQTLTGAGILNAALTVNSGGVLGGTLITGAVTSTGGIFNPGDIATPHTAGTLTVSGNFSSDSNTVFNYDLGTSSDLIAVAGNLTLGGTLNVTPGMGFATGRYTLMTYTGSLLGNTLTPGTMPTGTGDRFTLGSSAGVIYLDVAPTSYVLSGNNWTWNNPAAWTPDDGVHYPGAATWRTFRWPRTTPTRWPWAATRPSGP